MFPVFWMIYSSQASSYPENQDVRDRKKKSSFSRNRPLPSFYGARKRSKRLKVERFKLKCQRSFLRIVYGQWRSSTHFAYFKRSFQDNR